MLQEIHQQPEVLQTCLTHYLNSAWGNSYNFNSYSPLPTSYSRFPPSLIPNPDQIHILACGTSRHAGLIAQYWFEQLANIPTRVRSASEFVAAPLPLTPETLTIAITQSGETADTLAAIAQQQQAYAQLDSRSRILGITNHPDSSLANQADAILPTLAGAEIGVAATKTFMAQLAVLVCLSLDLAHHLQSISNEQSDGIVSALRSLPQQLAAILDQQEKSIQTIAHKLAAAKSCIILGQGVNRAIALEGALKFKETTYIHAEGYAAGEFLHGPIALLDATIPVIAIVPADHTRDQVLATLRKIKSHGVSVIAITTADPPPAVTDLCDTQLFLPATHPLLTPFLTVLPLQLLAYFIAVHKGLNVDRPRNITKTLTGN